MANFHQTSFFVDFSAEKILNSLFCVSIIFGGCCIPVDARGAAVSMDLQNPDRNYDHILSPYMVGIRKRVQNRWFPTYLIPSRKAKVHFNIDSSGAIQDVNIVQSSGEQQFDKAAVEAILNSNPYRPLPVQLLSITASFDTRYLDPQIFAQRNSSAFQNSGTAGNFGARNDTLATQQQSAVNSSGEERSNVHNDATIQPTYNSTDSSNQSAENSPASNSAANLSDQWHEPINSMDYRNLSDEERKRYDDWFKNWLSSPPSIRLKELAERSSVTKSKPSVGKKR